MNYLLLETGDKIILDHTVGFMLLEIQEEEFPKIINAAMTGRGPGITISGRGPGISIEEI